MSVEDDVAKVNEVTARLAGPQKVWVLECESTSPNSGTEHYLWICATEAKAREVWGEEVLKDCQRFSLSEDKTDEYLDAVEDPKVISIDVIDREFYSLYEKEVLA